MTAFGICAACLVGIGLYGIIVDPHPLRKLLAFNLLGGGIFLFFGVIGRRGAAAGMQADPVPQALIITGIVVAFSATALGIMIFLKFLEKSGKAHLHEEDPQKKEEG